MYTQCGIIHLLPFLDLLVGGKYLVCPRVWVLFQCLFQVDMGMGDIRGYRVVAQGTVVHAIFRFILHAIQY